MIEVLDDEATHHCANVAGQLHSAERRHISCVAVGSIVKIRMTNTKPQVLTLCEVEVFGIIGKNNGQ